MKKFLLVGIAWTFAIFLTSSFVSANGRYCLHYPGNPNCIAVIYDQNYGYAPPPPPMYYESGQIIYVVPPVVRYTKRRIRYAQPYNYYSQSYTGSYQYSGGRRYQEGGTTHHGSSNNGGTGGGKNGG